jgi:type I restriction enzyme S subunit
MGGEWRITRIDEVAERVAMGPFGSSIKVETFVDQGVPVISGQHLNGSRLDDAVGYNFITPEHADRLKNANVQRGDVIFTHAGSIGQVAYIPANSKYERYVISQRQFYLRPDPSLVLPEFIVAYFKTPEGQHKLLANTSQVGVPSIAQPVTYLRTIEIPLPPLSEQRAIAHILGTLDDKIELNRRMSETLEAMARAIFKAWFVDFEPVRAKMEGRWKRGNDVGATHASPLPGLPAHLYDLFPDRLVDSELGEIPEGWGVGTLGDVGEQLRETENPLESPDVVFHLFSIPAYDDGQWPKHEAGGSIKSLKSRVPPGVVLLSKLNPEIERVWLVDVQPDERAICSTEFIVLSPRPPYGRSFLYCLARSRSFRHELEGLVTGTSKSHQRAQVGAILKLPVVRAPVPLLSRFENAAETVLARSLACRRESRALAQLRDTLLPKLISGELRIKDAEAFLKERGL